MGENEKMKRKWRKNGEMKRKWRGNGDRFIIYISSFSPIFPPPLSFSCIKNCLILSQNVKYGTFVANVTKNLTYSLWENNSGLNSLRGSFASCAGLSLLINPFFSISFYFAVLSVQIWHGTPLHQLILGVLQCNLEIFAIISIKPCIHLAVFG